MRIEIFLLSETLIKNAINRTNMSYNSILRSVSDYIIFHNRFVSAFTEKESLVPCVRLSNTLAF